MDGPYLTFLTASGPQKLAFGDAPLTIGRHAENVLVLNDTQASRFHCVIAKTREGFIIRDLDSRNGTRLNGRPIQTAMLVKGDAITIGTTEFRLVVPGSGPQDESPPRPAVVREPAKPVASAQTPTSRPRELPPQPKRKGPAQMTEEGLDPIDLDIAAALQPSAEIEEPTPAAYTPSPADEEDALVDFGSVSTKDDDEKFLPVLAESLPTTPFDVGDISMINTRGQVVHEAGGTSRRKAANPAEAVTVLRYVLLICARGRATDVHVEPKSDDYQLRLRIDGNMIDVIRLTKAMGTRLCALVKILCDIDMQFKNIIQEGHFSAMLGERRVDYRVSFAPALFGQKLVIRVLDTANSPLHVRDLHLPHWMLDEVQRASKQDAGMILVTGPTGSGKTTTLYALLRDVGTAHRNVLTIEDPVEIEIEGATQIPVNEEKGNTFSSLLRSMLRQDPDVMMVGEIRDAETARIAMQAAMTGHLVLSTLHAKDTIGTVFRLLDLGVEPYLVSSSLQIVLAQRLARELCPFCKRAIRITPEQTRKMGPAGRNVSETFVPAGCLRCFKTGFSGRRAFFEMLTTTDELREVILKSPTPREIEKALAGSRFDRLSQTGYQLVAQGVTAFDEIERATGERDTGGAA
jgi:type II secretory ATPase GspE/PulE/Tfp pilus assembly ATPase PilB-like protein/pSer/pThr/pTyr-binding forkhead associated (FHA) protein